MIAVCEKCYPKKVHLLIAKELSKQRRRGQEDDRIGEERTGSVSLTQTPTAERVGGGGGGRKGSGWRRVNPLYIKLERFIIYHYTKPEIYAQLSLTPPPHPPTKSKKHHTGAEPNRQSASSRQWAKLICKYIQEIKKLNYTGK